MNHNYNGGGANQLHGLFRTKYSVEKNPNLYTWDIFTNIY